MNNGLFAPVNQPQQMAMNTMFQDGMPQSGQPAQMPQEGQPAQMPQPGAPAQMPQEGMPSEMPQEGRPSLSQNTPSKYSVGDPHLDRYINMFLA